MNRNYILCALPVVAFIAFNSCIKETVFNEVKVNGQYSVLIPEYLTPAAGMHQQASLQYQNEEKEIYVLVINESKADMQAYDLNYDIDTYYKNIVSTPFLETLKNGKVSIPGRQEINGNKALVAEITGVLNGIDVYYKMAVIETNKKFYQVLTWTRADRKEKYEKDLFKIIESVKEINNEEEKKK